MTDPNVEDALPASEDNPIEEVEETLPRKRWPRILLGLAIFLAVVGVALFAGYQSGISRRVQAESGQLMERLTDQYRQALEDQAAGRLSNARQRLDYILSLDPSFPGAKELLTEVIMAQHLTAIPPTATPVPTPTMTPTQDLRSEQQMFDEGIQYLVAREWNSVIQTLDALRTVNIEFKPVEVDGMYYTALRHRGVDKILIQGSLESGIYDLTLAEQIGPLDVDAINYRRWANMYLTAASYWDNDWGQVVAMFGDIYPALPGMRDGSGMTATERYRVGLINYAKWLGDQGQWCDAEVTYQEALLFIEDPTVVEAMTKAGEECRPPEPTAEPQLPTATPDPNAGSVTPDPNQPAGETPPATTPGSSDPASTTEPTAETTPAA